MNNHLKKIGFVDMVKETFTKRYAQFDGRATRTEFWYFNIAASIIEIAIGTIDAALSLGGILAGIVSLVFLLPTLTVEVRRLHDVNKSGLWILAGAVPLLNLYLLYLVGFKRGNYNYNKYGPAAKNYRLNFKIRRINDSSRTRNIIK